MIETTITKIQYDADGVQRRWSIPFQYADAKHISIYTKVGNEPTVKVADNYDIDEDDSVVIYPTVASGQEPLVAGTKITIARETPETQLEDASQVHFTSKDVERGLDKLTMITQELSTTAGETMEVSSAAFESAEEAVSTANEANATADEAKTLAGQAVSVANDANATATSANTKSDTAIKIANDANEKSASAVSTASAAKTVVDEANSTANKANAIATEAKEIAAAANVTAINADKIANEADKKADNAIIIATDAKSIAEGIDAKANQALDNSNTAINTANSAKQTAEGIDSKATQALSNSTTALETATEAKNTADSYQGQITTIESKIPSAASETNQLATKSELAGYLPVASKAVANGVASLDANTKVPVAQIPDLSSTYATIANTVSDVVAGSTADKINVTKNGSTSTITINNVSNAKTASKVDTEPGSVNAARYVYFEDASTTGRINYDSDFKYNPSTNVLTVGSITGNAATASRATADASGNTISTTYVKLSSLATVATSGMYSDLTGTPSAATANTLGLVKPDGNTITVTEDGTISATGGSGSGFDFEGTKAEFNAAVAAGTITEDSVSLITDDVSGDNVATKAELQAVDSSKADTALSNVLANIDYVVEFQVNAEGSWYRKYKSGWVEQGGLVTVSGTVGATVTLLKPFANTAYNIQLTLQTTNAVGYLANTAQSVNIANSKTTTSFGVQTAGIMNYEINGISWRAEGQGA